MFFKNKIQILCQSFLFDAVFKSEKISLQSIISSLDFVFSPPPLSSSSSSSYLSLKTQYRQCTLRQIKMNFTINEYGWREKMIHIFTTFIALRSMKPFAIGPKLKRIGAECYCIIVKCPHRGIWLSFSMKAHFSHAL